MRRIDEMLVEAAKMDYMERERRKIAVLLRDGRIQTGKVNYIFHDGSCVSVEFEIPEGLYKCVQGHIFPELDHLRNRKTIIKYEFHVQFFKMIERDSQGYPVWVDTPDIKTIAIFDDDCDYECVRKYLRKDECDGKETEQN